MEFIYLSRVLRPLNIKGKPTRGRSRTKHENSFDIDQVRWQIEFSSSHKDLIIFFDISNELEKTATL